MRNKRFRINKKGHLRTVSPHVYFVCPQMALQSAQVQSSQWRERYEEERIKCTQMRKSLVQNIDNINILQSQLEVHTHTHIYMYFWIEWANDITQ